MVKPIPQYGDDVGSTPALMSMLKCLNLCTESKHPIDLFLKNVQWYNGCTWGFDPHEPGSNPGWTTNLLSSTKLWKENLSSFKSIICIETSTDSAYISVPLVNPHVGV